MNPKIHLAQEHVRAGRFAQAKPLLLAALRQKPDDFDALALLTDAHVKLHELPQAEYAATRALKGREGVADAWTIMTMYLVAAGRVAEAEHSARTALDLDPTNPERYRHAAVVHNRLNQYGKMAVAAAEGAAISPQDDDLHLKHAVALLSLGQVERSAEVYRAGTARCPRSVPLAEGLAVALNYVPGVSAAERIAAHRRFGDLLAEQHGPPARPPPPLAPPPPGRPLRVGIISPDLRRHSVAYFIRPLLAHLDRARFDVRVYSTTLEEDGESESLRACLQAGQPRAPGRDDRWRTLNPHDPAAITGRVRDDRIDVLIELSGLLAGHNQRVVIRRAAPVQVTYLGYPSITGVPAIDARIVDEATDPSDADGEDRGRERLVRIAGGGCFLCYAPPTGGDDPGPTPATRREAGAAIVFGSFNTLRKLNEELLRLWKRVLEAVPASRLLLKTGGLQQSEVAESTRLRLRKAGIDLERVELRGPTGSVRDHLATYHEVDVALDTYPYCGTTTTCEALFMGVPVVSRVGDHHAARVGLSLLSAAGLGHLLARSDDEYVRIAGDLAAARAGPDGRRAGIRDQLLASPLCDGPGFATRFGATLDAVFAEASHKIRTNTELCGP